MKNQNEQYSYGYSRQQRPKVNNNSKLPPNYMNPNPNSMHSFRSIPPWANVQPIQSNQLVRYIPTPQNRLALNRRNEIVKYLKLVAMGGKHRKKMTKMVPYTIGIHDVLFQFLRFCPSFINPPDPPPHMQDPSGYYRREYVYDAIIPNLQREAALLSVSQMEGMHFHILEVEGAINNHLDVHPVFRCRMCPDYNPSILRKMKTHLREVHALFSERDLAKLYVDPDAVINFLHFAFVPEINYLR